MALSPQWAQSVVVRSDDGTIVRPQSHGSLVAYTYAAAGRPIIVRPRDPRVFTAASSHDGKEAAAGQAEEGGYDAHRAGGGGGQASLLSSLITGRDVAATFWVPDPKRNEVGLLEAMHRRTAANRTHVLLHSRPLPELQFNFSTCQGDNIDLSHDAFRLSKTSMAMLQLERRLMDGDEIVLHSDADAGGGGKFGRTDSDVRRQPHAPPTASATISGKAFKDQLRQGLRALHEEEYYLVRYRDYSAWAVRYYADIAKKDHFWANKYVEQCFAVHVGKEPGELIPITEAQFLFGVEMLQRQLLEQVGMGVTVDINYSALSKDQFRSLGVILGNGMRDVGVEGEELRRRQEAEREEEEKRRAANFNSGAYEPPSMWDWSPAAIKKRIDHQLQRQYQTLGRLVVRGVVLGVGLYVAWSYVRRALPSDDNGVNSRGQRRKRWGARDSYYGDEDAKFAPKGFLRSVMFGPKEVFDYLLAPTTSD
ncbi:uncharacterized protein Tco025E_04394 [Trypanosoma conorhini]|uniref:Uncharacterized protein n=1 Tax=Trypanosoma conorhini TaxID=83891 RepID=A0A422PM61_9TRYP|nr:uncharacterized protein Tco025E_04394 [Trypanosoma conorhini]RNF18817.1 hypothetical protein Tco025E_04394 [Trypanosoma conorhini]